MGYFYQWGRKDPFTYATSSETRMGTVWDYGKYLVKIYTIDGVLIYQDDIGKNNQDKQPVGGVIFPSVLANSMMGTIKTPNTFYGGWPHTVINQAGQNKNLWDYYWTSYSRGVDGKGELNQPNWHNNYLDDYNSQRLKSVYDPCPFGFRVASNGTYNQFEKFGWIRYSYSGGAVNVKNGIATFFPAMGWRSLSTLVCVGDRVLYQSSTIYSNLDNYSILIGHSTIFCNYFLYGLSSAHSVRCIDFCVYAKHVNPPRPTDEMLVEQLLRLIRSL